MAPAKVRETKAMLLIIRSKKKKKMSAGGRGDGSFMGNLDRDPSRSLHSDGLRKWKVASKGLRPHDEDTETGLRIPRQIWEWAITEIAPNGLLFF